MEADFAFRGIDLRDYYRPHGGPSRLTLRRVGVLVRHLPPESYTLKVLGSHGFSTLELLVMESGLAGPLNPRHPFIEAEKAEEKSRGQLLRERQAYFTAKSTGDGLVGEHYEDQSDAERTEGE